MTTFQTEEDHLLTRTTRNDANAKAKEEKTEPDLFDISWADVLIPSVAGHLTLKDLFSLRCCSRTSKHFVEMALKDGRKEINLSGNNSHNIVQTFSVLAKHCRRLESLHLARCQWLTDELLLPLLTKNTHHLRTVNLNECLNITQHALQPIIVECQLRSLKLSKCQWLTTGAVDAFTLHQNNLEELDISHCASIGERCLIIFFRKFNKLSALSLAYTPSVTDLVLFQIANYCRALQHINLIGCVAISDYGIHKLGANCPGLKSLMVHNCSAVTELSLAPLRGVVHIDRPRPTHRSAARCLYMQV